MCESSSRYLNRPAVALTIAGSDSCGGAGIQADLKTFTVLNVYGASVVTAVTAQNTLGVQDAGQLDADLVSKQIDSVATDLPIGATKTGMLGDAQIIDVVADAIKRHELRPVVVDPVMVAKSGDMLIDDVAASRLAERILPLATLVTPNRHEAARLLGMGDSIDNVKQAGDVARQICGQFGCQACIVKGIAQRSGERHQIVDVLFENGQITEFTSTCLDTNRVHGSGCTFSAAITAGLASGQTMHEAIQQARTFITAAIDQAPELGRGKPPVSQLAHLPTDRR